MARASTWPFAALSASYFAHIGFFNPYLPLWLKDMGYGLVAISLMTSIQSASRVFAPFAWGWLSDHTGQRVLLLRYCATAALLVSTALWWPWGVTGVFVVLLLMFTHTSAMMPMSEAALAHVVSQQGGFDARRYGRVRLWGSLGFLLTVLAAGLWFERQGMGSFPAWTVGTLVLVTLSVWRIPNHREPPHPAGTSPALWPVLRQTAVRWFFAAVFLHVLSHIFIYIFFSLYLDALGYSKSAIGLLWAVSVVVEIAWFFFQGRWLPLCRLSTWLVWAAALSTVRMAVTAGAGGWWWALALAQCAHAITFAAHHTACVALLSHHFPGRLRGRGQALYAVLGYGLSGVTGGLLGGWVSQRWGLGAVFWVASGAALLATAAAHKSARVGHAQGAARPVV